MRHLQILRLSVALFMISGLIGIVGCKSSDPVSTAYKSTTSITAGLDTVHALYEAHVITSAQVRQIKPYADAVVSAQMVVNNTATAFDAANKALADAKASGDPTAIAAAQAAVDKNQISYSVAAQVLTAAITTYVDEVNHAKLGTPITPFPTPTSQPSAAGG